MNEPQSDFPLTGRSVSQPPLAGLSAEVIPAGRTGDEGGAHPSRRAAIEFYISLFAVVFGTAGLLAHVWVLEVIALLVACVALGMVLVRCLPPDDR